ncbi:hypothetical protein PR048_015016 [Dryococelus australis]|uniref:Transposase n=1 Tax=Dryococelus australis TaxID=614101 RepID=A0ABQ9HG76_9NEOP|nr:hypothetical protein PR048_015016 [Dryococelus australis]
MASHPSVDDELCLLVYRDQIRHAVPAEVPDKVTGAHHNRARPPERRLNYSVCVLKSRNPGRQSTSAACGTATPTTTADRVPLERLKLHACKVQLPHALQPDDRLKRDLFAFDMRGSVPHGHSLGDAAYLQFLQDVSPEYLEEVSLNAREVMWFQQDAAPPHIATAVRRRLVMYFPNRWIGRGGPMAWPPRSPDITPPGF